MRTVPWVVLFFLALLATFLRSALIPSLPLSTFAPFLAMIYHRTSVLQAIWIALGCGTVLDLLGSDLRFGIHGLCFLLTTVWLHRQKKHFFEDQSIPIFLFTASIGAALTALQLIFSHLLDRGVPFSAATIGTSVCFMPLLDGLYGWIWFTSPLKLYLSIQRMGWKYWFLRKRQIHEQ